MVYAVAFPLSFVHTEGLQGNVPIWFAEVWEIDWSPPSTWKWLTSERLDRAALASLEWRAGPLRTACMFGAWSESEMHGPDFTTKVVEVVLKWSRGPTWSGAVTQADQPGKYLPQEQVKRWHRPPEPHRTSAPHYYHIRSGSGRPRKAIPFSSKSTPPFLMLQNR